LDIQNLINKHYFNKCINEGTVTFLFIKEICVCIGINAMFFKIFGQ
jgi:hypothetical protein